MKPDNVVKEKSYKFALRVVKLYKFLTTEKREFVLAKQVLRSGTAIGANVEEAIGGQSEKDFFAKICIAYKEARETHYWIRLLKDSGYLDQKSSKSILNDCEELIKLIGTIPKTMKTKIRNS